MARALAWSCVGALLLTGGALYVSGGPAILLDILAGRAGMFCL
jgi:hypothetical protein